MPAVPILPQDRDGELIEVLRTAVIILLAIPLELSSPLLLFWKTQLHKQLAPRSYPAIFRYDRRCCPTLSTVCF